MIYPSFLNVTIAPSNSGKTQYWLSELAATPKGPAFDRVMIFTFDQDTQYDGTSMQLEVLSYKDLKVQNIPRRTFVIMDELNAAMSEYPEIIQGITSIFTTRAHHFDIGLVCICQTVFKTPAYPLLRLTHSITLATQAGSNVELVQSLKLFKEVQRSTEKFLLAFQDRPYFVTIYRTVPYNFSSFSQIVYLRTDVNIRLYFCMNSNKDMTSLTEDAEKVLRPLLEKGYSRGFAIVPLDKIRLSKVSTSDMSESDNYTNLEKSVLEMIDFTVDQTQKRSYLGLWFFIKKEPRLCIDPTTLVLSYKKFKMGLQPFLSSLMYPSHLQKSAPTKKDAVGLATVLLSNPAFNPLKIRNRKLRLAASRFRQAGAKKKAN